MTATKGEQRLPLGEALLAKVDWYPSKTQSFGAASGERVKKLSVSSNTRNDLNSLNMDRRMFGWHVSFWLLGGQRFGMVAHFCNNVIHPLQPHPA